MELIVAVDHKLCWFTDTATDTDTTATDVASATDITSNTATATTP